MSRPSRRQVQAAETRRAILDAALIRFTRDGYGATSVADIADEAGVAVPTVYASVGPKPALLQLLLEGIDEKAGIAEQIHRLRAASDAGEVLARQVTIARSISERCGDVLAALASAASVEPELAAAYQAGLERHRSGCATTVGRIVEFEALAPRMDATRATAILATLTEPTVWRALTESHGWTFDQAEEWLQATLRGQLLAEP